VSLTTKPIKIAIIYGGRSSEHSVSCISAGAIMSHLDPEKYELYPIGITQQGTWTVGESDPEKLRSTNGAMPTARPPPPPETPPPPPPPGGAGGSSGLRTVRSM